MLFLSKTKQIRCISCLDNNPPAFIKFKIHNVKAIAIYKYNDSMKELIYQLKGCFDIELAEVLLYPFHKELKMLFYNYYMVFIPSNKEDDETRGFNHVKEIFKYIGLPFLEILEKKNKVKQSDRNFVQRKLIKYDLKVINIELVKNKKILIVDDVCTTGSTLKAAINLIKCGKPKDIKILVLSKTDQIED